jgi:Reverse transcriptase (RNA-dependent DNA polymerase)
MTLILALYVDDTLCLGHEQEISWLYNNIEKRFKIERLGQLKKHLGIWYEWKQEQGETIIEATIPQLIKEIINKYETVTNKTAKTLPKIC